MCWHRHTAVQLYGRFCDTYRIGGQMIDFPERSTLIFIPVVVSIFPLILLARNLSISL
jgi:hypothetical protein